MIDLLDPRLLPRDQIFTYRNPDTNTYIVFAIGLLQRTLNSAITSQQAMLLRRIEITQQQYDHTMRNQGIEEPRVSSLTRLQRDVPGIVADFGNGTQAMIDGNHRLVRRFRDGLRDMYVFWLSEHMWRDFLLDVPPETIKARGHEWAAQI